MIIGGIALAVGVVLLGVWLVKRKSPESSLHRVSGVASDEHPRHCR